MKRRGIKIEDLFTDAQRRAMNDLQREGFKLYSFLCGEHVIEMNRAPATGGGYQYAYITPEGRIER